MVDETSMSRVAEEILEFWFGECRERSDALAARVAVWFGGSPELDLEIARRWSALPDAAARAYLSSGGETFS